MKWAMAKKHNRGEPYSPTLGKSATPNYLDDLSVRDTVRKQDRGEEVQVL